MAWVKAGAPSSPASSTTTAQVTVPAGITAGMTVLVCVAGAVGTTNETPVTVTVTRTGITFTTVVPARTDTNQWWTLVKATGLIAGDLVNVALSSGKLLTVTHQYFDTDLAAAGTIGTRGGVSQTTVVAPALTVPAGSRVYVIGVERTSANGVTVSAANANGRTVTTRDYYEAQAGSVVSTYLGEFTEPTASTGATTLTYSGASTNASAVHIAEVSAAARPTAGAMTITVAVAGTARKSATTIGAAGLGLATGGPDQKAAKTAGTTTMATAVTATGHKQGHATSVLGLHLTNGASVTKAAAAATNLPVRFTPGGTAGKTTITSGALPLHLDAAWGAGKDTVTAASLGLLVQLLGAVFVPRDIALQIRSPRGAAFAAGQPCGHPVTIGAPAGATFTLDTPRSES